MSDNETLKNGIQSLLAMKSDDEQAIIAALTNLVKDFGVEHVQRERVPQQRHKNLLLHEFVRLGLLKTIEHAVNELHFDINIKRESDGNTALHLAYWYQKPAVGERIKQLRADMTLENNYGESVNDLERKRESMMNIVWLDTGETHRDCEQKSPVISVVVK